MGKNSSIEWTHHTFNPWWGCDRVSPACKHCYAEAWSRRVGKDLWGKDAPRRLMSDAYWRQPLAWNRAAAESKSRARVFCASMADVFEDRSDLDTTRAKLWQLVADTPYLDWLLLTKRPEHVLKAVPWQTGEWPANVWIGTTIETQRWASRRLPYLSRIPSAVRFVSCEPLLSAIDLRPWLRESDGVFSIDWVIAGGESGARARAMNPLWARDLRDQCEDANVPFHFKQWGNWRPADGHINGYRVKHMKSADVSAPIAMVHVGKKAGGRLLDGREWDGVPCPQ